MHIKNQKQQKRVKSWNELIKLQEKELKNGITPLQLSALTSWVEDCFEGFNDIYGEYLKNIHVNKKMTSRDYDKIGDVLHDLYFELQHIKNHIQDADEAFQILMGIVDKRSSK